uniref:Bifunctional terpene synthase n=1 Tax=Albizia julibrissin TaxID=3813 RepID=A0A6C0MA64_ALBJU|nr:bifunctional terpene synthase [Albizia julibrissin]
MSITAPSNTKMNATSNLGRQSADFHPSLWNDYFLKYASDTLEVEDEMKRNIETLKEEVRKTLVSPMEKPLTKAEVVDSIQCLGLAYHFEPEIDELLKQIHNDFIENNEITQIEDLHSLALLFKLLRQHGYPFSPDVFNKLKDEKGNFKETLALDVGGMITLYEACHLGIHGEDILDEALAFTTNHLQSITIESNPFIAAKINNVLKQCPYRGIPRLEARKYISIYHLHPSHNEVLLTLAKLNFNALQKLHQKECGNVCKWWNSLDVPRNLPYARDRIVESFFWGLSVISEPQYYKGRSILAKEINFLTLIDDTYDVYGTIDELELFTAAIERWDNSCLDDLPEYMKLIYKERLSIFEEIDNADTGKEERSYYVDYIIKDFKRIVQAYMTEARWLYRNHIPTTEEYLNLSRVTSCFTFLSMSSYICMGDIIVTEDIFKWVWSQPKIIEAASIIGRLMDDIVSNEFEQKRKHIASSVECYMKEHGVSREEAIDELRKMLKSAWKDINEECLRPTQVPMPFLMILLNLSRFMDVIYKEADNYTHTGGIMKEIITLLFVDPVPM